MITVHTEELLKIQQGSVSIEALKVLLQERQEVDFHVAIFQGNRILQILSKEELLRNQPTLMTSLVHGEHVFYDAVWHYESGQNEALPQTGEVYTGCIRISG